MSSSLSVNLAELTDSQRSALISLLADEDPAVYEPVSEAILSHGSEAVEWLKPFLLSDDPPLRRRARDIVDHFARQDADTSFLGFCLSQGEEFDMERGTWLLARTTFPNINIEAYGALLDSYAGTLRERMRPDWSPEELLIAINDFLFDELRFKGNEEDYYNPDNSYLNRVMDQRTGNPLSLCLVYMWVARRLKLPVTGIGMPGHFVCRYQDSRTEICMDAFNGGQFLGKADCIRFLVQTRQNFDESLLSPVSSRRMLLRICANLHQIYSQQERAEEVSRFQRYLVALAR